jgi:hypothetical protein
MREGHWSKTGLGGSATEVNSGESQHCRGRDESGDLVGTESELGLIETARVGVGSLQIQRYNSGFVAYPESDNNVWMSTQTLYRSSRWRQFFYYCSLLSGDSNCIKFTKSNHTLLCLQHPLWTYTLCLQHSLSDIYININSYNRVLSSVEPPPGKLSKPKIPALPAPGRLLR